MCHLRTVRAVSCKSCHAMFSLSPFSKWPLIVALISSEIQQLFRSLLLSEFIKNFWQCDTFFFKLPGFLKRRRSFSVRSQINMYLLAAIKYIKICYVLFEG